MPDLILLNGPPASGKSTLAAGLVATRSLALLLDLDVLRGQLGGWADDPIAAGRAARRLALILLGEHLDAGLDVVIPQLLVRDDFLAALEQAAHEHGARFTEVGLVIGRDEAILAFERRSIAPAAAVHRDAAMLVERNGGRDEIERLYDAYVALLGRRSEAIRVEVTVGDVPGTLARIEAAIRRS
jgi:predicted kinase